MTLRNVFDALPKEIQDLYIYPELTYGSMLALMCVDKFFNSLAAAFLEYKYQQLFTENVPVKTFNPTDDSKEFEERCKNIRGLFADYIIPKKYKNHFVKNIDSGKYIPYFQKNRHFSVAIMEDDLDAIELYERVMKFSIKDAHIYTTNLFYNINHSSSLVRDRLAIEVDFYKPAINNIFGNNELHWNVVFGTPLTINAELVNDVNLLDDKPVHLALRVRNLSAFRDLLTNHTINNLDENRILDMMNDLLNEDHVDLVSCILSVPNFQRYRKDFVLEQACKIGSVKIVKYLLDAGQAVTLSALYRSLDCKTADVFKLLRQAPSFNVFLAEPLLPTLIEKISKCLSNNNKVIMQIFEELLNARDININASKTFESGFPMTPLYYAAHKLAYIFISLPEIMLLAEMINKLIAHGANTDLDFALSIVMNVQDDLQAFTEDEKDFDKFEGMSFVEVFNKSKSTLEEIERELLARDVMPDKDTRRRKPIARASSVPLARKASQGELVMFGLFPEANPDNQEGANQQNLVGKRL